MNTEVLIYFGLSALLVIYGMINPHRRRRGFWAAFILFCLASFHWIRNTVFNRPEVMVQVAARDINKAGPQMVHREVRMDGATADGKRLIYRYTLVNYRLDQIDRRLWQHDVVPSMREAVVKDRNFTIARRQGAVLAARIYSADGLLVDEIIFDDKVETPLRSPDPSVLTQPTYRKFRNLKGVEIDARLTHFDGTNVTIVRADGVAFTNPITLYSESDQDYIRSKVMSVSK